MAAQLSSLVSKCAEYVSHWSAATKHLRLSSADRKHITVGNMTLDRIATLEFEIRKPDWNTQRFLPFFREFPQPRDFTRGLERGDYALKNVHTLELHGRPTGLMLEWPSPDSCTN